MVTSEVWHYLNKCEDSPVFHLETIPWSEEKRIVIDADEPHELSPEEEAIVDFIAQELVLKAGELGRLTKFMNPDISAWGAGNRAADLGPDACDRLSTDYQRMASRVASLTLDHLRRASTKVEDIEDAVA